MHAFVFSLQTNKLICSTAFHLAEKKKNEFPCFSMPKKGPDFTQSTHLDFELNETRGLLIMWTAFIQEELANMTELTDREKNPMLLVCLKDEIKESENRIQ